MKVLKWICIILGFISLIGIGEISWRGLKIAWTDYLTVISDYSNPRQKRPCYNYERRTR